MVQEQDQDWLARVQRRGAGRPPEMRRKEHALALCACGWHDRSQTVAMSVKDVEERRVQQHQVYDTAHLHAVTAHEDALLVALDCDEVRSEVNVPEPTFYANEYLRCQCRFYLIDSPSLQDAYNVHWDHCTVPEAVRQARTKAAQRQREVITPGDPLFYGWKHLP